MIQTNDAAAIEQARLDILVFIESKPAFPPDEAFIAPTFYRLAWAPQNVFDWTHQLHRDLYDLFATDQRQDKEAAYRQILSKLRKRGWAPPRPPVKISKVRLAPALLRYGIM